MNHFKIKDLVPLTYFLGLEITCPNARIHNHQQKYAEDLPSLAHLTNFKASDTTWELKLWNEEGSPPPNPTLFQQLVGSLIYLSTDSPDILHAIQTVNQFVSTPCKSHLIVLYWILNYIHGALDLHGYVDAD